MDAKERFMEGEENVPAPEVDPTVVGVEIFASGDVGDCVDPVACLVGVEGVLLTELSNTDRDVVTLVGDGVG